MDAKVAIIFIQCFYGCHIRCAFDDLKTFTGVKTKKKAEIASLKLLGHLLMTRLRVSFYQQQSPAGEAVNVQGLYRKQAEGSLNLGHVNLLVKRINGKKNYWE